MGTETQHTCSSDNKWHATGPPSKCNFCPTNFKSMLDLPPIRRHYRQEHNLCIICLKPWSCSNKKHCDCEAKHWEEEAEAKRQLIISISDHLKTLKVELRKQKYKFKENDTTAIILRLPNGERLELERRTVKEIKRMMTFVKERDDEHQVVSASPSSDNEDETEEGLTNENRIGKDIACLEL